MTETQNYYALSMRERDQWIVYATNDKQPRAPWQNGTLRTALWNSELDDDRRPETSFEEAQKWAERDGITNALPAGDDVDGLHTGYILPHQKDKYAKTLMLVDLDDVRDPETGRVIDEAQAIVNSLGSYTEVSQSGAGLHVFVYAELPEYCGKVVEPLETDEQIAGEQPKIEMYDHGRVAITTGRHVVYTPTDVSDAQETIDELLDRYYESEKTADEILHERQQDVEYNDSSDMSAYYDVSPAEVVTMGKNWSPRGSKYRGPHPKHGSTNNNNTLIEGQYWHCFRHDSGGIALHLVAVQEGMLSCGEAGRGALDKLSDIEFAELCMIARDEYGFPEDEDPPYRALLGVAKTVDLCDDSDERLGDLYDVALDLYHQNSWMELA